MSPIVDVAKYGPVMRECRCGGGYRPSADQQGVNPRINAVEIQCERCGDTIVIVRPREPREHWQR